MYFGSNFHMLETTSALIHATRQMLFGTVKKFISSANLIYDFKYLIKVSLIRKIVALDQ